MKITEENFIKQMKIGNEAALEYVMKQYGGLVKSVIHKHMYNLSQYEEDCINDVFFAAWTHVSSFDPDRNPFANWIAGVARLKALDYVRQHAKHMNEVHLEQPELEQVAMTTEESYDEHLNNVISEETEKLLSCLKEKDRELFYRLYVEEKTIEEVGQEMNIDRSIVYNRLSRAKKKLRKKFFVIGN